MLLRLHEVLTRVPVSRAAFYSGMQTGLYPRPVRIGKRTVAWRESDIDSCIAAMNASHSSAR
ncbi:MAG: DNA-binding protein [Variovorax paradoxus]|nr:MAG: DNA-binding protein [Variovorax paradoxus]PZQ04287.1 MAG: DNA-binding protein [Variovorax paradoxus]